MTKKRKATENRCGCKPRQDVCAKHDDALLCRHGCGDALPHTCSEREDQEEVRNLKAGEIRTLSCSWCQKKLVPGEALWWTERRGVVHQVCEREAVADGRLQPPEYDHRNTPDPRPG